MEKGFMAFNFKELRLASGNSLQEKIPLIYRKHVCEKRESAAPEYGINLVPTVTCPLSPTDIKGNCELLTRTSKLYSYDIRYAKELLAERCRKRLKKMNLYFFYMDLEASKRFYILDGGHVSSVHSGSHVALADMTADDNDSFDTVKQDDDDDEDEVDDSSQMELAMERPEEEEAEDRTIKTVPAFRLPCDEGVVAAEGAAPVNVGRLAKIIQALFVMMNVKEGAEQPVPWGARFYEFDEEEVGEVSELEEQMALAVFVAFLCKHKAELKLFINCYGSMLLKCHEVDASFAARMTRKNPEYKECRNMNIVVEKVKRTLYQWAWAYAETWLDFPVAVRCLIHALDPNDK